MDKTYRLWWLFGAALLIAFTILGFFGHELYRKAPPIPDQVVSFRRHRHRHPRLHPRRPAGLAVDRRPADGLDLGPRRLPGTRLVGRLAAPRGDGAARRLGGAKREPPGSTASPPSARRVLRDRLRTEMRTNRYDPETGVLTLSADRVEAVRRDRGPLRRALRRRPRARGSPGVLRHAGRRRSPMPAGGRP